MKVFRLILCAGLLAFQLSPALAFWHGIASGPVTGAGKSIVNFDYATSDIYNNLAKAINFGIGTNSPTSFFSNGYPTGFLASGVGSNPNPVTSTGIGSLGYYAHYVQQWTGVTEIAFVFGPVIVYSGGAGVAGVSPSSSGTNNGGGTGVLFSNNNHIGSALSNTSIVGNGTTMTVTTTANHGLTIASFNAVSIAGTATPSFNGTYNCQAATANTLTCPSTVSGTAGTPGTWQLNATNMNAEFSFGVLITGVGTNGGLVEMQTATNAAANLGSSATVQLNNGITGLPATGPNPDGSWSITKTSSQSFTLTGSSAYAGSVTVTGAGGPGTQSEAIFIPGNGNINIDVGSPAISHSFSNWIFARKDRLADALAGHIVSQAIVNEVGASGQNIGFLRYMDSLGAQGVYANFSDRIPSGQMSYASNQWRTGKWGGTAAFSSDNYTVSNPTDSPGGAYQDGEVVQFAVDSSSAQVGYNPTLQLGARGAAPIISTTSGFGHQITNYSPLNIWLDPSGSASANSSIVGNGTTATITTTSPHGLTNGAVYGITIAGSATPSFNATSACTVTGASTFTCPSAVSGTAVTPGTYQVQTAPGDIISITLNGGTIAGGTHTFQYYVNTTTASITASIAAGTNVLNVTAVASGTVTPGQSPNGSSSNGVIQPYGTNGTTGTGGTGTYALSLGKTSLTSITSAQGNFGPDVHIGDVASNLNIALNSDKTLTVASFSCANSSFTSNATELCSYYLAEGIITGSASVSGLGSEAVNVGTLFKGQITASSNRTMQYSGRMQAWLDLGSSGLFQGAIPLELISEISSRSGVGAFIDFPLEYTQTSWNSAGAFFASNAPGIQIVTELSNELWNGNASDRSRAQNMGLAFGVGAGQALFEPVYSVQGLLTIQNLGAFTSGYTGAGGSSSLVHPSIQNWALSSSPAPPDNGTMPTYKWNGVALAPTPATFTGVFGTTNGFNTVTVSGISGVLFGGWSLAGSCLSGTPHIVGYAATPGNGFTGNGTYFIDSVQSGTCTAMATNPAYSLASGPGGTAASTAYNASPNRPIDQVDGIGYAVYYLGALAGQGAGSWSGTQSFYNTLFQASEDYAQGIATSNSGLVTGALNAWATDLTSGSKNGGGGGFTINAFIGQGRFTSTTGVSPAYETLLQGYDGSRPSGKAVLNVYEYEGSQQVSLSANSQNPTVPSSATDLSTQFTGNGWTALDATYGYPSFGAGSSVTATNITSLFLAFVQSQQFYHAQLCLMQETKAVHALRKFYPAQFGINNGVGSINVPGAALWGIYTGSDINSTREQNWFAERDFSNGVTATCP